MSTLHCQNCDREWHINADELHARPLPDGRVDLTCPCGNRFAECFVCGNFVQPGGPNSIDVAGYPTHERCVENADEETIKTLESLGVTEPPVEFIAAIEAR